MHTTNEYEHEYKYKSEDEYSYQHEQLQSRMTEQSVGLGPASLEWV